MTLGCDFNSSDWWRARTAASHHASSACSAMTGRRDNSIDDNAHTASTEKQLELSLRNSNFKEFKIWHRTETLLRYETHCRGSPARTYQWTVRPSMARDTVVIYVAIWTTASERDTCLDNIQYSRSFTPHTVPDVSRMADRWWLQAMTFS